VKPIKGNKKIAQVEQAGHRLRVVVKKTVRIYHLYFGGDQGGADDHTEAVTAIAHTERSLLAKTVSFYPYLWSQRTSADVRLT
jgi:hypothetical protein